MSQLDPRIQLNHNQSVGTEVETTSGIISITLIEMSIDQYCDSEWPSREYLDYSHEKKYVSVGKVSCGGDNKSFNEAIYDLYGN